MADRWVIPFKVDLLKGEPLKPCNLQGIMLPGDNEGHIVEITIMSGGEPATAAGNVRGYFIRQGGDGATVICTGTLSGNVARVMMSPQCYAYTGKLRCVVRIENTNGPDFTLIDTVFYVHDDIGDNIVDPGSPIQDVTELLEYLDEMQEATENAQAATSYIASEYSMFRPAIEPYAVGDYVIHNGGLYRCTTPITSAETWTDEHWVQVVFGNEVSDIKSAIEAEATAREAADDEINSAVEAMGHDVDVAPKAVGSNAESVDLDVTDEDGNVLLRLANGHIKTKNFDSSVPDDITINPTNAEPSVDIDITDPNGNVVLRVESGHIKTKHFNSADFVPDETNPLGKINENPGLTSIFLHVGCIGDSLASGAASSNEGGTTVFHDMYAYSWGQYLARATGNIYYNFSSGGLTTKTWWNSQIKTTCLDGQHNCEAYIIGLGENDAGIAEMTVGTEADIDLSDYTQNADTFYGNYGKIIQAIQELQPKAKIFVITNPIKARETAGYNTAVRDMATIFDNVYIIDLYTYGLEMFTSGDIKDCKRNGHFNAVGYKLISYVISTYIDWIVSHNLNEFNQVEFIGTNWSYNN